MMIIMNPKMYQNWENLMQNKTYKNKKKGTLYLVIGKAIDATNSRDGNKVVVYQSCEDSQLYVRDEEEFLVKFELVGE